MTTPTPNPFQINRKPRARYVRIGRRKIQTQGLENKFWTDLYHLSLTITWPQFIFACVMLFLTLNTMFAFLYWLGENPIANARPGNFIDYFFFSVQTLATVGYGYMHPVTTYGNTIATIELYTGIIVIATNTGLTFARFSRPRARIVFARNAVISSFNGQRCLMLRMANARHNPIVDVTAKLWLVKITKTLEGRSHQEVHPLPLMLNDHPLLTLSWTIVHVIDENSPFFNMTDEERKDNESNLVISIHGYDKDAANNMHISKVYPLPDVKWEYAYVDIMSKGEGNLTHVDFTRFHDVFPVTND